MVVFKCKMCGGEMSLEEGATVAECPYCLTKQTLPKLDNDKRANMYDRANHFRRQNEYDKAMAIFENILQEDRTDAEAYWSLVLCRYGIEYVEDPATHKRVPTVNRVQYASILADEDYKSALEYADFAQRSVYEEEAKAIDEIQKGILAISKQEKPFDVFICYKETDANGRRTPDSVLANDLYHQLSNEGFKVFFSRITLEDKIGTAYEPYIFAALNSARVMVVLGTKPEYFNAVWVKNEWSRYLALIRAGADKTLVPAYRDMDPYGLPEEFSHLQAQDMGKLGFMQDLIRGIKKITEGQSISNSTSSAPTKNDKIEKIQNFLEIAKSALQAGNNAEAEQYANRIIEMMPDSYGAWIIKAKAVGNQSTPQKNRVSETMANFSNAIRYVSEGKKQSAQSEIGQYLESILPSVVNCKVDSALSQKQYSDSVVNDILSSFNDLKAYISQAEQLSIPFGKKAVMESTQRKILSYVILLKQVVLKDYAKIKWPSMEDSKELNEKQIQIIQVANGAIELSSENKDVLVELLSVLAQIYDDIKDTKYFATKEMDIEKMAIDKGALNEGVLYPIALQAFTQSFLETLKQNKDMFPDPANKILYIRTPALSTSEIEKYNQEGKRCISKSNELKRAIAKEKEQERQRKIQAEQEERKRKREQYWAAHADEKKKLLSEKAELEEKRTKMKRNYDGIIGDLKNKLSNMENLEEIEALRTRIKNLKAAHASLSLFKWKEKKETQAQINQTQQEYLKASEHAEKMKNGIKKDISEAESNRNRDLAPIEKRINEIEAELNRDR